MTNSLSPENLAAILDAVDGSDEKMIQIRGDALRELVRMAERGQHVLDPDEPAPDLDPEQHFGHEDDGLVSSEWLDKKPEPGEREYEDPRSPLSDETTMAEEPIEQRLRRAFLNGFKEGVDRASNTIEGWGRWDA